MNAKPLDLEYAVQNEFFIACPFLTTDRFIKYCKERGLKVSRKQLERFEELRLFFPVARVRHPVVKRKIRYSEDRNSYWDLGLLEEGEEWDGDVREEYGGFVCTKEYAEAWLREGLLWEPGSLPFETWDDSRDENTRRRDERFYSVFQCYPLRSLIKELTVEVHAEWWTSYGEEKMGRFKERTTKWAEDAISFCRENGVRGMRVAELCQAISNRYFPSTQTDRRTINLSYSGRYDDWDWHEYSRNWDAQRVLDDLGSKCHQTRLSSGARYSPGLPRPGVASRAWDKPIFDQVLSRKTPDARAVPVSWRGRLPGPRPVSLGGHAPVTSRAQAGRESWARRPARARPSPGSLGDRTPPKIGAFTLDGRVPPRLH